MTLHPTARIFFQKTRMSRLANFLLLQRPFRPESPPSHCNGTAKTAHSASFTTSGLIYEKAVELPVAVVLTPVDVPLPVVSDNVPLEVVEVLKALFKHEIALVALGTVRAAVFRSFVRGFFLLLIRSCDTLICFHRQEFTNRNNVWESTFYALYCGAVCGG
jgi:hypothetical protein